MFIARVEILHQRRSEERNPTRPSARKHISAPPNAAGGVFSSGYKHATPNGVKRNAFFHSFYRTVVLTSWDCGLSDCETRKKRGASTFIRWDYTKTLLGNDFDS